MPIMSGFEAIDAINKYFDGSSLVRMLSIKRLPSIKLNSSPRRSIID
jgi:hypothetical protein